MNTKFVSTRFDGAFGTLNFDEKTLFNLLLGFTSYWDYKINDAINADSSGVHSSEKFINLITIDNNHSRCDCLDRSVVNCVTQPIPNSLVLNKPPGYKVLREPETIHYKKRNKTVSKTITNYLEDKKHKELDSMAER